MKINLSKEWKNRTLIGGIVLHNLTYILKDKIIPKEFGNKNETEDGLIVDLKLIMDGEELNLVSYMNRWEKNIEKIFKKEVLETAKNLIIGKFVDIEDMIIDLKERIKPEIDKRLEDWGKEDE